MNFANVLCKYSRLAGRNVHVSWLGGEPLQWSGLAAVSRLIRRLPGLSLGVTTNGVALTSPSVRELLTCCYEQVTISIDGPVDFHDRVRGMPGLYRQLEGSVAKLRAEATSRMLLRVNTVLMRDNISLFPEFCATIARWGFDELTFNQLGGDDRPEFFAANRLLPEQVRRFCDELPELARTMADRGLRISYSPIYLRRLWNSANNLAIAIEDCRPGRVFLFIDERGNAAPCHFTCEGYGVPIRGITTADSLAALPRRFAAMRAECRHAACEDCHATHVSQKFSEPHEGMGYPVRTPSNSEFFKDGPP